MKNINAIKTTHLYNDDLLTLLAFKVLFLSALCVLSIIAVHADNKVQKTFAVAETEIAKTGCVFETKFDALVLKPLASNIYYSASTAENNTLYDVLSTYQFGFDLGLAAYICDLDSRVSVGWQHIHTSDGSLFDLSPENSLNVLQFNFDQVNFNYGQSVVYNSRLEGYLYYGGSFAHIKQMRNHDTGNAGLVPSVSSFDGAGIQVGFDFAYDLSHHFQVTGQGAVALLAGKSNYSTSADFENTNADENEEGDVNIMQTLLRFSNKRTQFVPALEQKVGLAYFLPYGTRCHFKLEAGYQAQVYFNALQSDLVASTSDFALIGPYVSVSLGF